MHGIDSLKHHLQKQLVNLRENLQQSFLQKAEIPSLQNAFSQEMSQLIIFCWQQFNIADDYLLLAAGSLGRKQLCPFSDIDLIILIKEKTSILEEKIAPFIRLLWDIKLFPKQIISTETEYLELATQNVSIFSRALDSQLLCGNSLLFSKFQHKLKFLYKLEHYWQYRIEKNNQRYNKFNLLDNIHLKNSPGGTLDFLIVKQITGYFLNTDLKILLGSETSQSMELLQLELTRLRFLLHFDKQRNEERLSMLPKNQYEEGLSLLNKTQGLFKSPLVPLFQRGIYESALVGGFR